VSSREGFKARLARIERSVVGGFMRVIAIVAERRFRKGLEEKEPKRSRHGVHVDVRDLES
jgi:hypothetical protein